MNDLDKRFNFDFDGGNTEPYGKRNVNLLISFNSDENLTNNSPTWLNNGSSKTNSDNGSISRSGKHSNVPSSDIYMSHKCNLFIFPPKF